MTRPSIADSLKNLGITKVLKKEEYLDYAELPGKLVLTTGESEGCVGVSSDRSPRATVTGASAAEAGRAGNPSKPGRAPK